jgi:hypothetical protein
MISRTFTVLDAQIHRLDISRLDSSDTICELMESVEASLVAGELSMQECNHLRLKLKIAWKQCWANLQLAIPATLRRKFASNDPSYSPGR